MLSTGPQSSLLSRSVPSLVPPVSQPPATLIKDTYAPHNIFLACCEARDMTVGPENGEYNQKSRPSSPVSDVINRGLPSLWSCNGSPKVPFVGSPISTAASQAGTSQQLPDSSSNSPEHSTHGLSSAEHTVDFQEETFQQTGFKQNRDSKGFELSISTRAKRCFLGGLRWLMPKKTDKTD